MHLRKEDVYMSETMNLASKYAKRVDERFTRESQALLALNNDYNFTGVRTVNVYSIPTVAMTDYARSGDHRYGTPNDLTRNIQTLTVAKDRAFTFIIDRGDRVQSQMVMDAGKALARQLKEVWVPEFDTYVFRKLAAEATARGNIGTETVTKSNAYELFLNAMEHLGNKNVPDKGRVAFCSYRFANYLKQDPAFMKYGDSSQEMVIKGVIGEVDGCKIVKVPSGHLPSGCAFLLTHPLAATAPRQLEEYKTHVDPPGLSGFLVEGRVVYDCFVLGEKADAIYYHGNQPVLRQLNVTVAKTGDGEVTVLLNPGTPEDGCTWMYKLSDTAETVTYDGAISGYTALTASGAVVETGGKKLLTVVECTSSSNPGQFAVWAGEISPALWIPREKEKAYDIRSHAGLCPPAHQPVLHRGQPGTHGVQRPGGGGGAGRAGGEGGDPPLRPARGSLPAPGRSHPPESGGACPLPRPPAFGRPPGGHPSPGSGHVLR